MPSREHSQEHFSTGSTARKRNLERARSTRSALLPFLIVGMIVVACGIFELLTIDAREFVFTVASRVGGSRSRAHFRTLKGAVVWQRSDST